MRCMARLYAVEVEPEVRSWLERLSDRDFGSNVEVAEVARALQAQKTCEAEHGPAHDTFDREAS
jgi:hypothetical protein